MRAKILLIAMGLGLLSSERFMGNVRADEGVATTPVRPAPPLEVEQLAIQALAKARVGLAAANDKEMVSAEHALLLRQALNDLALVLGPDIVDRLKGRRELLEAYVLRARANAALGEHHSALGEHDAALDKFEQAVADAQAASKLFPHEGAAQESQSDALFVRGNHRHNRKEYRLAISDFKAALNLVAKPRYQAALAASLARLAVEVTTSTEREYLFSRAIKAGEEAMRSDPRTFAWNLNLGHVLVLKSQVALREHQPEEAVRLSERAVSLAPGVRAFNIARMWSYINAEKYLEAFRDGDLALSLSPYDRPLAREVGSLRARRAENILQGARLTESESLLARELNLPKNGETERSSGYRSDAPTLALKYLTDAIGGLETTDDRDERNEYYYALLANSHRKIAQSSIQPDIRAMTHYYGAIGPAETSLWLDPTNSYAALQEKNAIAERIKATSLAFQVPPRGQPRAMTRASLRAILATSEKAKLTTPQHPDAPKPQNQAPGEVFLLNVNEDVSDAFFRFDTQPGQTVDFALTKVVSPEYADETLPYQAHPALVNMTVMPARSRTIEYIQTSYTISQKVSTSQKIHTIYRWGVLPAGKYRVHLSTPNRNARSLELGCITRQIDRKKIEDAKNQFRREYENSIRKQQQLYKDEYTASEADFLREQQRKFLNSIFSEIGAYILKQVAVDIFADDEEKNPRGRRVQIDLIDKLGDRIKEEFQGYLVQGNFSSGALQLFNGFGIVVDPNMAKGDINGLIRTWNKALPEDREVFEAAKSDLDRAIADLKRAENKGGPIDIIKVTPFVLALMRATTEYKIAYLEYRILRNDDLNRIIDMAFLLTALENQLSLP